MAGREQPYDPYIPAGGSAPGAGNSAQDGGNQRTAALQAVSYGYYNTLYYLSGWGYCDRGARWPEGLHRFRRRPLTGPDLP